MTFSAPAIWFTIVVAACACRGGVLKPSPPEHPERVDVRVSDSAICSRCELELSVVGIAGADSQAPRLVISSAIALLDSGQIAVAPISVDGLLAVYRADGRLARTIPIPLRGDELQLQGRDADGRFHITSADTIVVVDQDGQEVRRVRLPMEPQRWLPLRSGTAVIVPYHAEERPWQRPVHIVTPTGQLAAGFGAASDGTAIDEIASRRIVAPASNGGVWVGSPSSNTIELYDSTGAFLRRITRVSPSFDRLSTVSRDPDGSGEIGAARLASIFEDGSGVLWTLTMMPTPRLRSSDAHALSFSDLFADKGELLSTRVEMIDPGTGQLLRAATCPGWLMQLLGPATIGAFRKAFQAGVEVHILKASWNDRNLSIAPGLAVSGGASHREICAPTNFGP